MLSVEQRTKLVTEAAYMFDPLVSRIATAVTEQLMTDAGIPDQEYDHMCTKCGAVARDHQDRQTCSCGYAMISLPGRYTREQMLEIASAERNKAVDAIKEAILDIMSPGDKRERLLDFIESQRIISP